MRRDEFAVNPKRVARLRREEGLKVSKRQRRMLRLGTSTCERQRAERRHVWGWDFLEDQTEAGSRFRILTLIDKHTRECLATHAAWSIRAVDVIGIVEAAITRYGAPEHIRSDNRQEFIAYSIQDWLAAHLIKTIYIISKASKTSDSTANFSPAWAGVRVILEGWRVEYSTLRPHSSLDYQSLGEFGGMQVPPNLSFNQSHSGGQANRRD